MNYSVKGSTSFEVDVFVPSRSLAFEYNGEYHYNFVALYTQVEKIAIIDHFFDFVETKRCFDFVETKRCFVSTKSKK